MSEFSRTQPSRSTTGHVELYKKSNLSTEATANGLIIALRYDTTFLRCDYRKRRVHAIRGEEKAQKERST